MKRIAIKYRLARYYAPKYWRRLREMSADCRAAGASPLLALRYTIYLKTGH